MFLSKQNKIKWNLVATSFVILLFLLFIGIFCGVDKQFFIFLRGYNFYLWKIFGYVFDAKVWLILFFCLSVYVYLKKTFIERNNPNVQIRWFRLRAIIKDFFAKVKNNFSFLVFSSVFFASIITTVLKFCIGRSRPILFEGLDLYGFYPFINEWAFNSMPSGHVTASFAGLVMIGMLLGKKIKYFTWGLAIIIAISRICIGAHWPTDVLLGAFIGMLSADIILVFCRSEKK